MKRIGCLFAICVVLLTLIIGAVVGWTTHDRAESSYEYLIGVSQANMTEPWRIVLMEELKEEAEKYPELRLVFTDATSDSGKQQEDIQQLLTLGIDLLIVSPWSAEELTDTIAEVYEDIPVIVMDRNVEGYDYSLFIGPDNEHVGQEAAKAVKGLVDGDKFRVLELTGANFSASADRSAGFDQEMGTHTEFVQLPVDASSKDAAEDAVRNLGKENVSQIDVVFAHNDYIALGASKALEKMGVGDIPIVGVDGFTGEDGGLNLVEDGVLDATISCPTGGRQAIQYALDILHDVSGIPKQVIINNQCITADNVDEYRKSLNQPIQPVPEQIRVGYAQLGTESGWRLANNESIRQAAEAQGIDLTIIDADNNQNKQIEAVRQFIEDDMDVIVLSPSTDQGWEEVLMEAKAAGIPVLLSDREIQGDGNLYQTFIGADFVEEGRRAARWMIENVQEKNGTVRILEIQGSQGASPTIDRSRGFTQVLDQNPSYQHKVVWSQCGDYTRQGGKEVIEEYCRTHVWNIDVIFSHNDDMALGAIEALEARGIQPGKDVKIISVDGIRDALKALEQGKINCVVECSPLLGPQLMKAIHDVVTGRELPLRYITDESVFTQETPIEFFRNRVY